MLRLGGKSGKLASQRRLYESFMRNAGNALKPMELFYAIVLPAQDNIRT